jgi:hypothetical protein
MPLESGGGWLQGDVVAEGLGSGAGRVMTCARGQRWPFLGVARGAWITSPDPPASPGRTVRAIHSPAIRSHARSRSSGSQQPAMAASGAPCSRSASWCGTCDEAWRTRGVARRRASSSRTAARATSSATGRLQMAASLRGLLWRTTGDPSAAADRHNARSRCPRNLSRMASRTMSVKTHGCFRKASAGRRTPKLALGVCTQLISTKWLITAAARPSTATPRLSTRFDSRHVPTLPHAWSARGMVGWQAAPRRADYR